MSEMHISEPETAAQIELLTHFIGGYKHKGTGERFSEIFSPSTGGVQSRVPFADVSDVDAAVAAAKAAAPAWAETAPLKRSHIFFSSKQLLVKRSDELAETI